MARDRRLTAPCASGQVSDNLKREGSVRPRKKQPPARNQSPRALRLLCCLFNEVSDGLPTRPKLRLALGHIVPERHVSNRGVVQHALQQCRRHQFLGDARERRPQAMPLDLSASSLVDPGQRLSGVDDREEGLFGLAPLAVSCRDLERLGRQQQLVIGTVLRIAQHNSAGSLIDITNRERRVAMQLVAVDRAGSGRLNTQRPEMSGLAAV